MDTVRIALAEYERSAASPADLPGPPDEGPPPAEIAFCGRSNVGKSSLINFLVERKGLVRTSRTPGRTRLTNFFRVELLVGGARRSLRLVDLPGFGYAKVSKDERATWRPAIEAYLAGRAQLAVVALLVDARRGPELDERELAPWIAAHGKRVVAAITKSDQVPKHERPLLAARVRKELAAPAVVVSVNDQIGRDELWSRLLAALPADP